MRERLSTVDKFDYSFYFNIMIVGVYPALT